MIIDDVFLTPDELKETRQKYYTCINNPKEDSMKTEREAYDFQMKYLETRDTKYLKELEAALFPYAKSLILQKIRLKKYKFIPEDNIGHITELALEKFMALYYKPKPFAIWGSFAGYLVWKVLDVLGDYVIQQDKTVSLDEPITDNGQTLEAVLHVEAQTEDEGNFITDFIEENYSKLDAMEYEQELKLYKLFAALYVDLLHKKQCVYNLNIVYEKICRTLSIDKTTHDLGEVILIDVLKEAKKHALITRDAGEYKQSEEDGDDTDFEPVAEQPEFADEADRDGNEWEHESFQEDDFRMD